MNNNSVTRIIKSSIGIDMLESTDSLPVKSGSACIIQFETFKAIFSVAHVTNINAGACIPTGHPAKPGYSQLYSVGAMYYLTNFNNEAFKEQLEKLKSEPDRIEEQDFGQVDICFAPIPSDLEILQHEINIYEVGFKVNTGKKTAISSSKINVPNMNTEYGFFGRIKATKIFGTPMGNLFEAMEVYYGGLQFVRKIGHYYEFALPQPITDHADFKGTSGAPIMDKHGNLVSLVTHGYEGGYYIYGVALADFASIAEVMMLNDNYHPG